MPSNIDSQPPQQLVRPDLPHTPAAPRFWYERVKRALDFILALIALILAAPMILLAALAIKLTSRGPVFYSQTRAGKNGRPYTIYKLRTMVHNCEGATGARWAIPGDPRITRVGRLLRRTHIDELPQLWNILRGEMGFVGPRPERPEFVEKLKELLPDYARRLSVQPGLTGLAQIQLPPDTDLESVRRKLLYDLYYVERRSVWLDIRIMLSTGCKVLAIPFAVPRLLLRIPSGKAVEVVRQTPDDNDQIPPQVQPSFSSVS